MPLPPTPLCCTPTQPWLCCRCRLCHLQPLLHLIVVFRSLSCEPTSADAAATVAVADAASTCCGLSANPTAAADAIACRTNATATVNATVLLLPPLPLLPPPLCCCCHCHHSSRCHHLPLPMLLPSPMPLCCHCHCCHCHCCHCHCCHRQCHCADAATDITAALQQLRCHHCLHCSCGCSSLLQLRLQLPPTPLH